MLGGGFRKKSNRNNLRKKIDTADSDDDDGKKDKTELPSNQMPANAPKTIKTKPNTMLSFGDELENDEEFVIKRTKASSTLENQVKKEKKLKKRREKNQSQELFVEEKNQDQILKSNMLHVKTFSDDEDYNFKQDDFGVSHKFNIKQALGTNGNIPDAAMIYAMKKKREQARQFGDQVAYIPLNTNKYEGRFPEGNSRLIREDDSSEDERIEMKGTTATSHPQLERRKQVAKALEEFQDEDSGNEKREEHDDEIQRWEEEQIKKGSHMPTNIPETYGPKLPLNFNVGMLMDPTTYAPHYAMTTLQGYCNQINNLTYSAPQYSQVYQIPSQDTYVYSIDIIGEQLRQQVDAKKQLHHLHKQQLEKTDSDLHFSLDNLKNLENKTIDISERFTFYQDIRGFARDLIECLNEKVKQINELESGMHSVLSSYAEKLVTRRQNDVKDEVEEISGKPNTDNDRINNIRNRRIAEREGRRARRRESRKGAPHYDGMSSDDEVIPSERLRYEAEQAKILKDAETVFDDVVSDFKSIREIMSRFEQWKFAFSDTYKEAFLGICLPKLFAPFVTLELLNWKPLEVQTNIDLESMNWFKTLILYGHVPDDIDIDDDDIKLVPNIIEKSIIPKLTVIMRDVWDPLSSKQTKLSTCLFQRLVHDFPTITKESKTTKLLVDAIVTKLKSVVETELYIPLYPRSLLEANNSRAFTFLERQFWKGFKLLCNLMEWNWLLSQSKLQELGVDAILNRYLIIALQQYPSPAAALERVKSIVSILPKEWFEKSDQIIPGLQSVSRYLVSLSNIIYKSSLGYNDEQEKKRSTILIKKTISILMHIQAFDEARLVAKEFKDKDTRNSPS
ncbi:PAX3- and PAX7-binding protein 1 isoform X2 [Hydra vulgaris]|uniref:PAX3- and PAX7-binding protein 1 isoform X2 n=1 Tax=Hydra vulgaris TaxID=6087 RepID=A0ABM4BHX4_HYDVU